MGQTVVTREYQIGGLGGRLTRNSADSCPPAGWGIEIKEPADSLFISFTFQDLLLQHLIKHHLAADNGLAIYLSRYSGFRRIAISAILERLLVQSASSTFTSSARWSRSPPASVWTVSPRQSKAEMLLPVFLLTNDRWSFSFDASSLWPMVFFVVAGKNVLPAYYGINFCTRCALNFNFLVGQMYFLSSAVFSGSNSRPICSHETEIYVTTQYALRNFLPRSDLCQLTLTNYPKEGHV